MTYETWYDDDDEDAGTVEDQIRAMMEDGPTDDPCADFEAAERDYFNEHPWQFADDDNDD